MPPGRYAARGRTLVMLIVAWLVGVFVYDVARENFDRTVGFILAAATFAVSAFARWRATKHVGQTGRMFEFWLALPLVLFIVVPCVVKLVILLTSAEELPWWSYFTSLLPFLLKLGVPVAALLWIYVLLGKLTRRVGTHCPKCGYDLAGNVSGRCPQCGAPCDPMPAAKPCSEAL